MPEPTMIRSLHIIGSRQSGGAENFYLRLVGALHAAGHPTLAVAPPDSAVVAALGQHVPRHPLAMRSVWDLPARLAIRRLVKRQGPCIVQTYMGRATRLTHLRAGGPAVHVARLGGYYNLKGYRHAHAWVGNTRGICDYLIREGLPAARVFHISNFVDPAPRADAASLTALRQRLTIPAEARVVLTMGRLHPVKGFGELLEAMAAQPVEVDGRPLYLIILGDGELRAGLIQQAHRLGLEARLRWPGWVNDPSPYLQLADLFVCPSRHEPLGNVILEAWSQGVPVLSTATLGATELIRDGDNGVLVPLQDSAALGEGITRLLGAQASEREALAAAGLATLQARHSRSAIVEAYLEMYRALLASV